MPASQVSLTAAEREWLAAHPVIRYAPDPNYSPVETVQRGVHSGITADYLRILEKKLGIRFTLVPGETWDLVLERVYRREIDVIGSCVVTPERQDNMSFTAPYLTLRNVIIVRTDGPQRVRLADLRTLRVCVVTGHAVREYLLSQLPDLNIEIVSSFREGLRRVSFGNCDAMIGDVAASSYEIQREGITNLRIAGQVKYDYHIAFATRKDWPELVGILDKGLTAITAEERQAIWEKWVRLEQPSFWTSHEFWSILGLVLLATGLVLGAVVAWNRSLKRQVRARTLQLQNELAERGRIEESLRQSERSYREIFNATREAILIQDAATSAVLDVNDRMLEMFGYTRQEAIGLTTDRISAEEGAGTPETLREHRRMLEQGPQIMECRVRRKNGEIFWVEVSLRATRIGGEGRVLAVVRDITQRKCADEERRRLEEDLRQAQKMEAIGTLAAGIAHDFNNLLTIISGFTALARTHLTPEHAAQEPLGVVETAVTDASGITRSLLTLTRKSTAIRTPVDIREVVQDSLRLLRRVLPASIQIREELPPDGPVYVNADVGQLHQSLLNLITNARDAMPAGGSIRLELAKLPADPALTGGAPANTGKQAVLVVEDTGTGMPSEVLDHAFEPFFTTKPRGRGTGLGLTMVHAIIGEHQGRIHIDSEPGQGTRVSIHLPVCDAPEQPATPQVKSSPPATINGTVLLAEDSPEVRAVIVRALQKAGCEVVETGCGQEAACLFASNPSTYRAAVLDVDLPRLDGLEVAGRIHGENPHCPVVIISGNPDIHANENGRLRTLRKPFAMPELVSLLGEMIKHEPRPHDPRP
jgi:PAS domain S-box-containing protein